MKLARRNSVSRVLSCSPLNVSTRTVISGTADRTEYSVMSKSATFDSFGACSGSKNNGACEIGVASQLPYVGRLAPTPSGYMHGEPCRHERLEFEMFKKLLLQIVCSTFS